MADILLNDLIKIITQVLIGDGDIASNFMTTPLVVQGGF